MNSDPVHLESIDSLDKVIGVGSKTSERLKTYFDSEKDALEKIKDADILEISKTPGISFSDASRIVKKNIENEYGSDKILETESLEKIYQRLLDKIKDRARTSYGKARLNIYFPTSSKKRVHEVRDWVRKVLEIEVQGSVDEIKNVEPPEEPRNFDVFELVGNTYTICLNS